jgi:hypothetical protein
MRSDLWLFAVGFVVVVLLVASDVWVQPAPRHVTVFTGF